MSAALVKGYDTTLEDVAHQSLIQDFFAQSRVYRRKCPECGTRMQLALWADNSQLAICPRKGCSHEEAYE